MHRVETGGTVHKFRFITSVSNISQMKEFDYTILVQNEDTVDIWGIDDRVRGTNDLVRYYKLWNDREINEQDLFIMHEWP